MKIIASLLENGHICIRIKDHHYYILPAEYNSVAEGKTTMIDDGSIMVAYSHLLVIYPNPHCFNTGKSEVTINAETLLINANIPKLFTRIIEVTKKLGVDKKVEFNTESFCRETRSFTMLNFAQIAHHAKFFGHEALKLASKLSREQLLILREMISRKLSDGFSVYTDWAGRPDFYFNGGGYNGGIIYHQGHGYSIHT